MIIGEVLRFLDFLTIYDIFELLGLFMDFLIYFWIFRNFLGFFCILFSFRDLVIFFVEIFGLSWIFWVLFKVTKGTTKCYGGYY